MHTVLFCVLSLIAFPVAIWFAAIRERARKLVAERELGFWDANVHAALEGSAIT